MPKSINRKTLVFLLTQFLLLLVFRASAQIESTQNTLPGPFTTTPVQSDTVTDPKFVAGATWTSITNKSVQDEVALRVADNVLISTPFVYTVNLQIQYYTDPSINTPVTVNTALTVSYFPGQGKNYKGLSIYNLQGAFKMVVTVTGVNLNGYLAPPTGSVELSSRVTVDRSYAFQPTGNLAASFIYTPNKQLQASWTTVPGAEEYDVEWTTINTGNPNFRTIYDNMTHTSSPDYTVLSTALGKAFVNNSSRVVTDSNAYTISVNTTDSLLLFRIRQAQYDKTTGVRKTSPWDYRNGSSYAIWKLNWTEMNINWQYSAAFAEDGKKKEVVSYFDGGLRNRQTVTVNNSDNVAVAQENVYDEFGRPVASILPAPYKESSGLPYLHYIKNFNINAASKPYRYLNVTGASGLLCEFNPDALNTISGASRYYSSAGQNDFSTTINNKFIPDAEGFPLSLTQYTNDNTGRIKSQGGVGLTFQPGKNGAPINSKTTKYYYGKPEQWELDQLFGNDVGYAEHYLKNMVVDPNGQISLSYLNASGKTIATALAGQTPVTLDPLTSYSPVGPTTKRINLHLLKPDQFVYNSSALALSASTTYLASVPGTDTLRFSIEKLIDTYPGGAFQVCSNCYYLMTVKVTDDCNNIAGSISTPVQIGSAISDCNGGGIYNGTLPVAIGQPGEYNVNITFAFDNSVIQSFTDNFIAKSIQSGYLEQQFGYIKKRYLDSLDVSGCYADCHTCSTMLGSQSNFVQMLKDKFLALEIDPASVAARPFSTWADSLYTVLKGKCTTLQANCPFTPCTPVETLMKMDLTPGGQYALFDASYNPLEPELNVLTQVQSGQTQPNWRRVFPILPATDPVYLANGITLADNSILYPNSSSFSVPLLVANWRPEWADKFLPYHPEQCKLTFCYNNAAYESWDLLLQQQINTAADVPSIPTFGAPVLSYSYNNADAWLLAADPFFNGTGTGHNYKGQMQADLQQYSSNYLNIVPPTLNGKTMAAKGIMKFVDYMLYCTDRTGTTNTSTDPDSWGNCSPNPDCRVTDREWLTYRDYYFKLKEKYYTILRNLACTSNCPIGQPVVVNLPGALPTARDFNVRPYNGVGTACAGSQTIVIAHDGGPVSQQVTVTINYPSSLDNSSNTHTVTFNIGESQKNICVGNNIPYNAITIIGVIAGVPPTYGNDPTWKVYVTRAPDTGPFTGPGVCGLGGYNGYRTIITLKDASGNIVNAVNPVTLTVNYYRSNTNQTLVQYPAHDITIPAGSSTAYYSYPFRLDNTCSGGYDYQDVNCYKQLVGASNLVDSGGLPSSGNLPNSCGSFTVLNNQAPPADPCKGYAGKISRFPGSTGVAAGVPGITSGNQLTDPQYTDLKNQATEICTGMADSWIDQLRPGMAGRADSVTSLNTLRAVLIGICSSGADIDHPLGASTATSSPYGYTSFGAAIKGILIQPANGNYTAKLNPYLIDSPPPANVKQQSVPLTTSNTSSDLCTMLQQYTQQAAARYMSLYDYLVYTYKDAMTLSQADVATLQKSCNNCRFILDNDVTLPAFLDPGKKGAIWRVEYQAKKTALSNEFGGTLSVSDPNYEKIFSNYMNQQWGFVLSYDDYAAYDAALLTDTSIRLCNKTPYKTLQLDPYQCIKDAVTRQVETGKADYDTYIADNRQLFRASYINACKVAKANASMNAIEQIYHYTLYYYDQADNLVRTIPPEGVTLIDSTRFAAIDAARDNDTLAYVYNGPTTNSDKTAALNSLSATLQAAQGAIEMWLYNSNGTSNYHVVEVTPDKKWLFQFGISANRANIDIYPLTQSTASSIAFNPSSLHFRADISSRLPLKPFTHVVVQGPLLGTTTASPKLYINGTLVTLTAGASPAPAAGFTVTATASSVTFPDSINTLKHLRLYTHQLSAATIAANSANTHFLAADAAYLGWYRFNVPAPGDLTTVSNETNDETTLFDRYNTHVLPTTYAYNSTNQVNLQNSPDGGTNRLWYDMLSRLIASQNDKQLAATNTYSYTKYDLLGRIIEVGQKKETTVGLGAAGYLDNGKISDFLAAGGNSQITNTWYDRTVPTVTGNTNGIATLPGQRYLRKRVAASTYKDTQTGPVLGATYYNYDLNGNVKTLWQQIDGLYQNATNTGLKRIDYEYDLISGKVNFVAYQVNQPDAFYYMYKYDAENRLKEAWTGTKAIIDSTNGSAILRTNRRLDAYYYYYLHGPLSRMELGNDLYGKVQGVDYAYTLQGWLKGVNSTQATATTDMGLDGSDLSHKMPKDAFGYHLDYYGSSTRLDYKAAGGGTPFSTALQTGNSLNSLYNGNIVSSAMNIPQLGSDWLEHVYQYDQLNRIKAALTYHVTGGASPTFNFNNDLDETFSYDGNGNILTLFRSGAGTGTLQDSHVYYYNRDANQRLSNNRLNYVYGHAGASNVATDQAANNYTYDQIGNMTADVQAGITNINWNIYGKITSIVKGSTGGVSYKYDAAGHRVSKTVGTLTTYYVRDAQGNPLAVYDNDNFTKLYWREQHLYGSSRLGMWQPNADVTADTAQTAWSWIGRKEYELNNHLGNVMATITDKRLQHTSNSTSVDYYNADVATAQDYYAFGGLMPGRQYTFTNAGNYRYGFNGKESDNDVGKGTGNQQDYGMRIYDPRVGRFLSVDPLHKKFPFYTPYSYTGNKPIWALDLDGNEEYFYQLKFINEKGKTALTIVLAETINYAIVPDFLEPDSYKLRDVNGMLFEFDFKTKKDLYDFVQGKTLHQIRDISQKALDKTLDDVRNITLGYELMQMTGKIEDYAISSDFSAFDDPTEGQIGSVSFANFAQSKIRKDEEFSPEGQRKYSKIASTPIKTVNDLVEQLKAKTVRPSEVPVDYVIINNTKVILNTRTSTALTRAGVPMSQWSGINKTGMKVPGGDGETFDDLARQQMKRNKIEPVGTSVRPR
jgi:RHS repeat-associated protein